MPTGPAAAPSTPAATVRELAQHCVADELVAAVNAAWSERPGGTSTPAQWQGTAERLVDLVLARCGPALLASAAGRLEERARVMDGYRDEDNTNVADGLRAAAALLRDLPVGDLDA